MLILKMVNCCVAGCKSRTERKCENITFHTFPKDENLRKVWIAATGRQNWQPTQYTRMCSIHFKADCFQKKQLKIYLIKYSIPTLRIHSPSSGEFHPHASKEDPPILKCASKSSLEYQNEPSTSKSMPGKHMDCQIEADVPMDCDIQASNNLADTMTPRKLKLTMNLQRKSLVAENRKKKIAALRTKTRRLMKKNAVLTDIIENLKTKRFINQEAADLLSILNDGSEFIKPNKSKFSPEVRKFALNLHFISPRAYNYVRQHFKTCLPHTRTLARWYATVDGEPGFSSEALQALEQFVKNNNSTKLLCSLCFDEMAIRKCVQWDGKNFVGFANYGHNTDQSDSLPVAKEALVFMLTCLNGSWKLPIGYFLVNGVSAEQKSILVKTCIDLVSERGVDIVSLTFDGCPANFSMARVLGCQLDGDVINPTFTHKEKKVTIFPDPSHMLKLVRNTLGDKGSLINSEGKSIDWHFVQTLVEIQENEGCHLGNKVRAAHVNYKKQIMKVRLAAQLFSESVATSIEFCKDDLKLSQFQNSEATIDFIRKFNTLFDILNTKNFNAFGCKKPLNTHNFGNINKILDEIYVYINSLKIGQTNILQTNRKTGFLGFLIAIKSIIFLFNEYVKKGVLQFLCTYKLSQDHLEIFFSAVRAKGGFNNNPTAIQFKSAFKRLLVHGELKHLSSGNCVPLSDINILVYSKPEIAINKTTDRNRLLEENLDLYQDLDAEVVVDKDHDYISDPTRITEFSRTVIIYIAGFVVKRLKTQIKCQDCLSLLTAEDKNENTLQFKKDKGGLHYPSKSVIKLCEIAERAHRENKISSKTDHMHHLLQICLKRSLGLNLFSNDQHAPSEQHFPLLIKATCKKYLNVRIHYSTKSIVNKEEYVRNMYNKLTLFKGQ